MAKQSNELSHFTYPGCDITYDTTKYLTIKLCTFRHSFGTLKRIFKNKTRKETQIKFHKVMAVPTLRYGSETWVLIQKYQSSLSQKWFI